MTDGSAKSNFVIAEDFVAPAATPAAPAQWGATKAVDFLAYFGKPDSTPGTSMHVSDDDSTGDWNILFSSAVSRTSFTFGVTIDPECQRRLQTLETFDGDAELGFRRPDGRAVDAVRVLLTEMYREVPQLESPVISPAADGEIIVSWRRPDGFLTCHFERNEHFEWIFKQARMISGTANAADRQTQSGLAKAVFFLCGASALLPPKDRSHRKMSRRSSDGKSIASIV